MPLACSQSLICCISLCLRAPLMAKTIENTLVSTTVALLTDMILHYYENCIFLLTQSHILCRFQLRADCPRQEGQSDSTERRTNTLLLLVFLMASLVDNEKKICKPALKAFWCTSHCSQPHRERRRIFPPEDTVLSFTLPAVRSHCTSSLCLFASLTDWGQWLFAVHCVC